MIHYRLWVYFKKLKKTTTMKSLFVILSVLIISCTKDIAKPEAICDFVFAKYFQNPAGDTTLANRTYWLNMARDTTASNPGNTYVLQVPKSAYDTMLVNSSWEKYCY